MKIDFHTHGRLAKKLPFDSNYTDQLFMAAQESGLDGICLTEHFNTFEFDKVYDHMDRYFEKDEAVYIKDQLKIFPGMEVDAKEGGHLLMIGKVEEIREMNKRLLPFSEKGKFLSAKEILQMANEYDLLKGIAHPFRTGDHLSELPEEVLKGFDFADLNGKDLGTQGMNEIIDKTTAFAQNHGLSLVTGSDTHQAIQYGIIWTEFQEELNKIQKLKELVKEQKFTIGYKKEIPGYVHTAGIIKSALKEIHRLGGNYIPFADCSTQG